MCTRFVYNGIDKIVGFNFDIDLSVWDHTVITEENRFYIGIKMPDGLYHSFHGINKNGNVGTLLYVHGNENARYIESEDCITISELTEKFIKAEISFDKALDIVKKKKIIYAPDATMPVSYTHLAEKDIAEHPENNGGNARQRFGCKLNDPDKPLVFCVLVQVNGPANAHRHRDDQRQHDDISRIDNCRQNTDGLFNGVRRRCQKRARQHGYAIPENIGDEVKDHQQNRG